MPEAAWMAFSAPVPTTTLSVTTARVLLSGSETTSGKGCCPT